MDGAQGDGWNDENEWKVARRNLDGLPAAALLYSPVLRGVSSG